MPISLNDYVSLIKDPAAVGIFRNMQRMNNVLKLFPVVEVGKLVVRGVKWTTLPSHAFRKIGGSFTPSTGKVEPQEDILAIYGGSFDEDEAFEQMNDDQWRDPVELQFEMHARAMERGLMNHVINGDIDTDPDGFNGLFDRLGDTNYFAAAQTISASGTTDSLKVLASQATARQFFEKYDEALMAAGLYGGPDSPIPKGAALMNRTTFLGIQRAAVMTNLSIYTHDLLGYRWFMYGGIPFVEVGLQRDRSTEIIGNSYNPGDGGNDSSRIVIVRLMEPSEYDIEDPESMTGALESPGSSGLTLVQCKGIRRLGPIKTLTSREWGLEWILGIAHIGDDYCVSMLDDFKMAAS